MQRRYQEGIKVVIKAPTDRKKRLCTHIYRHETQERGKIYTQRILYFFQTNFFYLPSPTFWLWHQRFCGRHHTGASQFFFSFFKVGLVEDDSNLDDHTWLTIRTSSLLIRKIWSYFYFRPLYFKIPFWLFIFDFDFILAMLFFLVSGLNVKCQISDVQFSHVTYIKTSFTRLIAKINSNFNMTVW